MLEWLLAPVDPTAAHDIGVHLSWHARFMTLAWGVLVPVGVLVARYFKIWPGQDWPRELDSQSWWNTHKLCQYSAFVCLLVGMGFLLNAPEIVTKAGPHKQLGWAVIGLAVLQVAGGLLRGTKGGPTDLRADGSMHGDHFDMSRRRLIFESVHKSLGYLAVVLGMVTILFGLWQANAPNWMPLALILWWSGLIFIAITLQRRGMAIDTYQAIWGPDPSLPGAKTKTFAPGVTRHRDTPSSVGSQRPG
ncbi:MAG: cytochrome b561 domain-containing protein [Pseudomonadota bacterium]